MVDGQLPVQNAQKARHVEQFKTNCPAGPWETPFQLSKLRVQTEQDYKEDH